MSPAPHPNIVLLNGASSSSKTTLATRRSPSAFRRMHDRLQPEGPVPTR